MPAKVLLCATHFERRHLSARLSSCFAAIETIGVGDHCVNTLTALTRTFGADTIAILAGVGGGLTDRAKIGRAYIASQVTDSSGAVSKSLWIPSGADALALFCSDTLLIHAHAKTHAARAHACDLVDMESRHFVAAATRTNWKWLIVRGVSDDDKTALPRCVMQFVNGSGRLRPLSVLRAVLSNPSSIAPLMRLGKNSKAAMQQVCSVIERVLQEPAP